MSTSIQEQVIDIIIDQLGVDPDELDLETDLMQDLNADSLDLTELIMAFEEHFDVEIPTEQAQKLRTVGDIIDHIETCQ